MKKSVINSCLCLLAAVLIAAAVLVMACYGCLPGIFVGIHLALVLTICLLMLLFALAAFSSCHCTRRLLVALCRYGSFFVIALIVSLFAGIALLVIPCMAVIKWLFLVCLFFSTASFVFAMMMLAAILYTMVTLGCPRCPAPDPKPCPDTDFDDFKL